MVETSLETVIASTSGAANRLPFDAAPKEAARHLAAQLRGAFDASACTTRGGRARATARTREACNAPLSLIDEEGTWYIPEKRGLVFSPLGRLITTALGADDGVRVLNHAGSLEALGTGAVPATFTVNGIYLDAPFSESPSSSPSLSPSLSPSFSPTESTLEPTISTKNVTAKEVGLHTAANNAASSAIVLSMSSTAVVSATASVTTAAIAAEAAAGGAAAAVSASTAAAGGVAASSAAAAASTGPAVLGMIFTLQELHMVGKASALKSDGPDEAATAAHLAESFAWVNFHGSAPWLDPEVTDGHEHHFPCGEGGVCLGRGTCCAIVAATVGGGHDPFAACCPHVLGDCCPDGTCCPAGQHCCDSGGCCPQGTACGNDTCALPTFAPTYLTWNRTNTSLAFGSPSGAPSTSPSPVPSHSPSASPSASARPSASPSASPSTSESPSASPSASPSETPSTRPTSLPSSSPSVSPTVAPTPKLPSAKFYSLEASTSPGLFLLEHLSGDERLFIGNFFWVILFAVVVTSIHLPARYYAGTVARREKEAAEERLVRKIALKRAIAKHLNDAPYDPKKDREDTRGGAPLSKWQAFSDSYPRVELWVADIVMMGLAETGSAVLMDERSTGASRTCALLVVASCVVGIALIARFLYRRVINDPEAVLQPDEFDYLRWVDCDPENPTTRIYTGFVNRYGSLFAYHRDTPAALFCKPAKMMYYFCLGLLIGAMGARPAPDQHDARHRQTSLLAACCASYLLYVVVVRPYIILLANLFEALNVCVLIACLSRYYVFMNENAGDVHDGTGHAFEASGHDAVRAANVLYYLMLMSVALSFLRLLFVTAPTVLHVRSLTRFVTRQVPKIERRRDKREEAELAQLARELAAAKRAAAKRGRGKVRGTLGRLQALRFVARPDGSLAREREARRRRAAARASGKRKLARALFKLRATRVLEDSELAQFRKAARLDRTGGAESRARLGAALLAAGDVKGALEEARRAVALDAAHVRAHRVLGRALAAEGDVDGAIAAFRRAVKLEPSDATTHVNLAAALSSAGDAKGSLEHNQIALVLDPDNPQVQCALGATLVAVGDFAGAIAALQKAIAMAPRSSDAQLNLGDALRLKKDLRAATLAYEKSIAYNAQNSTAHTNLGSTKLDLGDVDAAVACHRTAIDIAPRNFRAHCNMGIALRTRGDMDAAVRAHRTAIKCNPRCSELYYALGKTLQAQGTYRGAVASFEQAVSLDIAFGYSAAAKGRSGSRIRQAIGNAQALAGARADAVTAEMKKAKAAKQKKRNKKNKKKKKKGGRKRTALTRTLGQTEPTPAGPRGLTAGPVLTSKSKTGSKKKRKGRLSKYKHASMAHMPPHADLQPAAPAAPAARPRRSSLLTKAAVANADATHVDAVFETLASLHLQRKSARLLRRSKTKSRTGKTACGRPSPSARQDANDVRTKKRRNSMVSMGAHVHPLGALPRTVSSPSVAAGNAPRVSRAKVRRRSTASIGSDGTLHDPDGGGTRRGNATFLVRPDGAVSRPSGRRSARRRSTSSIGEAAAASQGGGGGTVANDTAPGPTLLVRSDAALSRGSHRRSGRRRSTSSLDDGLKPPTSSRRSRSKLRRSSTASIASAVSAKSRKPDDSGDSGGDAPPPRVRRKIRKTSTASIASAKSRKPDSGDVLSDLPRPSKRPGEKTANDIRPKKSTFARKPTSQRRMLVSVQSQYRLRSMIAQHHERERTAQEGGDGAPQRPTEAPRRRKRGRRSIMRVKPSNRNEARERAHRARARKKEKMKLKKEKAAKKAQQQQQQQQHGEARKTQTLPHVSSLASILAAVEKPSLQRRRGSVASRQSSTRRKHSLKAPRGSAQKH